MSLSTNIYDAFVRAATQDKLLKTLINGNAADLGALTTTDKTNLVNAINELVGRIATAAGIDDSTTSSSKTWSSSKTAGEIAMARAGAVDDAIDDSATSATTTTLSASAILSRIANAKSEIIGGAGSAYDTLVEIQGLLQSNDSAVGAINTALANRVRVDAAQSLTAPQAAQARDNIGAASAAAVGDPTTNFVTAYEAALV